MSGGVARRSVAVDACEAEAARRGSGECESMGKPRRKERAQVSDHDWQAPGGAPEGEPVPEA